MHTRPTTLRTLLARRPSPSPRLADPADMGTCIGLEFSLDQPPAEPVPDTDADRPWWRRLSLRKPAQA